MGLQYFDLFCIGWDPSDDLGMLMASLSLIPQLTVVALVVVILSRRELEACYLLMGLLTSTVLNKYLKEYLAHDRPIGSPKEGYGMPSDHAQFMFFLLFYVSWMFLFRNCFTQSKVYKSIAITTTLALSTAVAYSRIRLNVHSEDQVLAGALLGSFLSISWTLLGAFIVRPHVFPWIEDTWAAKWFLLKDSTIVPDILEKEYKTYLGYRNDKVYRRIHKPKSF